MGSTGNSRSGSRIAPSAETRADAGTATSSVRSSIQPRRPIAPRWLTSTSDCGGRHNAPDLEQSRSYRELESKLAEAQRRGHELVVKTTHAKIANRRKDALHKYSRVVVNDVGALFVRNISSSWQTQVGNGKIVLAPVQMRSSRVLFAQVDESYTTQDCSTCLSVSGAKSREDVATKQWVYSECGTAHDRDGNAAITIAPGCKALGLQRSGSSAG